MPTLRTRSWVSAPVDEVFAFFDDPANLSRLMPPLLRMRLVRVEPEPPQVGSTFEFRYGLGPFQRSWTVRLVDRIENSGFADETISGPMASFRHSHTFTPARRGTWIEDRVDFHVGPDGPVGVVIDLAAMVGMRLTFVWRGMRQRLLLRG
jgi:ligand-binding SRPBCC domain-containing protein